MSVPYTQEGAAQPWVEMRLGIAAPDGSIDKMELVMATKAPDGSLRVPVYEMHRITFGAARGDVVFMVPGREQTEPIVLADGQLVVNPDSLRIEVNGRETALRPKQRDLLLYLGERADHVVKKEELCNNVWRGADSTALRTAIRLLRSQLGSEELADPLRGVIRTITNVGYIAVTNLGNNLSTDI